MRNFHLQFFVVLSIVDLSLVSAQSPAPSPTTESTTKSTTESTTKSTSESMTEASVSSTAGSGETKEVTTASTTASTTEASTTTIPYEGQPDMPTSPWHERLRIRALVAHNYRRSRLAMGLVRNRRGRTLPTASNMRHLEYNCTSEAYAIQHAVRCSVVPPSTMPSFVQENHHMVLKSLANTKEKALIVAIKHWWSQIRINGGIGKGVRFTQYNVGTPTEWFTRMAWATTEHFGCYVESCGFYWNVICLYYPGGNKLNEQIYMKGEPCSECPFGTFCNEDKLCEMTDEIA